MARRVAGLNQDGAGVVAVQGGAAAEAGAPLGHAEHAVLVNVARTASYAFTYEYRWQFIAIIICYDVGMRS